MIRIAFSVRVSQIRLIPGNSIKKVIALEKVNIMRFNEKNG